MVTTTLRGFAATMAVLVAGLGVAHAQNGISYPGSTPVRTIVVHQAPAPVSPVANATAANSAAASSGAAGNAHVPMYPLTNAPLYPSPVPYVPHQVGGAAITNQAFAPQEYLYPHTYRAMYGPFYYKVKGRWVACPLGSKTHENWELLGTEVEVKYKSHISPLSRFVAPIHHRR